MILGNDFVKLKIVDSKKKRPLQAGLQYAKVTWRMIMDTGHASFGQMRQNYSSLATALLRIYQERRKRRITQSVGMLQWICNWEFRNSILGLVCCFVFPHFNDPKHILLQPLEDQNEWYWLTCTKPRYESYWKSVGWIEDQGPCQKTIRRSLRGLPKKMRLGLHLLETTIL